jgi:hypothetical protein
MARMGVECGIAVMLTLMALVSQDPAVSVDGFAASDVAAKRRILNDIAASRSRVPVQDVIALVRAGTRDGSADVRRAALAAVTGRSMAAWWAGTRGPEVGPAPAGAPPPPPRAIIPSEWRDDQRTLRDALYDDCVVLLRTDAAVRHDALLAVGNLERPVRPDDPMSDRFVQLLLDLYRNDRDARIRAEVVKTFGMIANNSEAIRAVLKDALVDPTEAIRREGLNAITPQAVGGTPKLSFEDARPTLLAALRDADAGVRLGAVRALNVFGAPARGDIPLLERIRDTDPDAQVRASARLAIEAIRRAIRDKPQE